MAICLLSYGRSASRDAVLDAFSVVTGHMLSEWPSHFPSGVIRQSRPRNSSPTRSDIYRSELREPQAAVEGLLHTGEEGTFRFKTDCSALAASSSSRFFYNGIGWRECSDERGWRANAACLVRRVKMLSNEFNGDWFHRYLRSVPIRGMRAPSCRRRTIFLIQTPRWASNFDWSDLSSSASTVSLFLPLSMNTATSATGSTASTRCSTSSTANPSDFICSMTF